MDANQLCERLGKLRAAGEEGVLALRESNALRRNERSSNRPKRAGRNPDILQFRNVQSIRLIRNLGEIRRMLAGLLLLVLDHLQARDLQRAVLADRKMDGLCQREVPHFGRILHRALTSTTSPTIARIRNKCRAIHYMFLKSL